MTDRYDPSALTDFAASLFRHAGLDDDKARVTAEILVEGDLMGHTTHGLALLPAYLAEAEAGHMAGRGEPEIVAEAAASQTWDGRRLPGPWLTQRAARWACERAAESGTAIGMAQLLQAAQLDAAKRDKPYSDAETRGWV